MNRRTIPALILTLVLALAFAAFPAAADDYSAGAMRLLRYDGDVEILNPEGVPRFVMENVRFDSGEAMHTGESSSASVGLDDTKIVTLDANTKVQFIQEDSHIRLNLTEGAIFVDVSEKLDENESFDIQTTTMTVGIRGTLIYVKQGTGAETAVTAPVTTIGVLEGAGRIDYQDNSGTRRVIDLPAGNKVTLTDAAEGQAVPAPVVTELVASDIAGFVADTVRASDTLTERVINGSPDGELLLTGAGDDETPDDVPHPASGDWTWPMEVQLVAQSASKLYDGRPLRRPSGVLVYGLPADCSIQVSSEGSQTDAGQTANNIGEYAIFNNAGENVTEHFTNIVKVPGVLRVDPAPLTIWTGSAEKVYDGEPLICEEADVKTIPGHIVNEPVWRNTSIVTRSALGTESMIGVSGSVWVHGANPLTGEVRELMLGTGQRLSVSLTNENGADSISFTVETLTVDEIPDDVLQVYAQNPDLMAQAIEDTGWDEAALLARVRAVEKPEETAVMQNGLSVPAAVKDDVLTDSSNVRINIDSNVTNYNTRPLTEDEAHFVPITLDPSIKVTATGSQTAVGESENAYEIDWGNANKNNYEIIFDPGKLTVTPLELDVNIGGGSATYSGGVFSPNPSITYLNGAHAGERVYGTRHSAEAAVSDTSLNSSMMYDFLLFTGDTVTLTISGMGSEPGTYTLSGSVRVASENGGSVSASYSNATVTIEPAVLSIYTGSATKKYDGKPLTNSHIEVTGLVGGESVTVEAAGSQTEVGSSRNTYRFWWNTADPSHYTIREHLGTLEVMEPAVKKITVTITGAKVTKMYTGEEFQAEGYTVSIDGNGYSAEDFTFDGDAFADGTIPGTYPMGLSADQFKNNNGNFDVTFKVTDGSLVITKNDTPIIFTAPSAEKVYDGKPLFVVFDEDKDETWVTVENLDEEVFRFITSTKGSQTVVGTGENNIVEYVIFDNEENDVTEYFSNIQLVPGDLVVTPNETAITITPGSADKVYDGEPLTAPETYIVTGLPNAEFPDYQVVEVVTSGSQTDVGTGASKVDSYKIINGDGEIVTDCFSKVTKAEGILQVVKAEVLVSITGNKGTNKYTGEQFRVEGYTVTSIDNGSYKTGDFSYTGAAAAVGTIPGDYPLGLEESMFENNNPNFDVSFSVIDGGLTITTNDDPVTVTAQSASKEYDGTVLIADSITVEGLPSGITYMGASNPEGGFIYSNVGTVTNKVDFYVFKDSEGTNVTAYFTKITEVNGTLEITKCPVTVTIKGKSETVTYNGLEQVLAGHEITDISTDLYPEAAINFSDPENRDIAKGTNVGTYKSNLGPDLFENTNNNFDVTFSVTPGSLIIDKKILTVKTLDLTTTYDGGYLPNVSDGPELEGLLPGDDASVTARPAYYQIKDVGTTDNSYEIEWTDETVRENYKIKEDLGTLTIDPAPLYLYHGGGEKQYDGTPLNASEITYEGLVDGESIEITSTGSITHVNESGKKPGYSIAWGSNTKSTNYTVNTDGLGELSITPVYVEISVAYNPGNETFFLHVDPEPESVSNSEPRKWLVKWPWGESFTITVDEDIETFDVEFTGCEATDFSAAGGTVSWID